MAFIELFLEGILSFFSPCALPLVPLYIGYLTKDTREEDKEGNTTYNRKKTMLLTLGFVLGISVVFFIAGLTSSVLRVFFNQNRIYFLIIGGFLLILLGLSALHIIEIPLLNKTLTKQTKIEGQMTFFKALVLGFFFSFAWSPCVGPMLAKAIMQASSVDKVTGWLYIACYTLGFIFIFLLLGLFTTTILNFLKKYKGVVKYTSIISGLVVLAMGLYMMSEAFINVRQLENGSVTISENGEADEVKEESINIDTFNFTLKDGEDNSHSLKDYEGKTIVMSFFGTWCGYCNMELPGLQKVNDEYDDVKVILIATPNIGDEGDIEYVESYLKGKGYSLTVLYDTTLGVTQQFGVTGYPTTFIIKPDGNFLGYIPGYFPEENLIEAIDTARGV